MAASWRDVLVPPSWQEPPFLGQLFTVLAVGWSQKQGPATALMAFVAQGLLWWVAQLWGWEFTWIVTCWNLTLPKSLFLRWKKEDFWHLEEAGKARNISLGHYVILEKPWKKGQEESNLYKALNKNGMCDDGHSLHPFPWIGSLLSLCLDYIAIPLLLLPILLLVTSWNHVLDT